jgi:hypothetical protein
MGLTKISQLSNLLVSPFKKTRRLQAAFEVAGLANIDVDYERQSADLSPRASEQFGG